MMIMMMMMTLNIKCTN